MKKLVLLFSILYSISIGNTSSAQTNNNQAFEIFANDHFNIFKETETYFMKVSKDEWETICLKLNNYDKYKTEKLSFQIGINENINLSVTSHSQNNNSEVTIYETYLKAGTNIIEFDLSKFDLDFNNEILLYFHINKGEKWNGDFSINLYTNKLNQKSNKLSIFPNPCREEFKIECEENKGNIQIINSTGTIVKNMNFDINNTIKHNLASGTYTVIYTANNHYYSGIINIIK
jgi:hypothetical protein